MSALAVTDSASNRREQIKNFAEILSGAPLKIKLVILIYKGKKELKSVDYLASALKKSRKEILSLGSPLASQGLFEKAQDLSGVRPLMAYKKIPFVSANRDAILRLARKPKELAKFATKSSPQVSHRVTITLRQMNTSQAHHISLLDLEQFRRAKRVKASEVGGMTDRLSEFRVKQGISRILGELEVAKDWGGEIADIVSGIFKLGGKSKTVAFALKGPAKSGPLVPAKMGKNGDQIQRLFRAPVTYHFVQYEGVIDVAILEQMKQLAIAKALMGQNVYYGTIDGTETKKLRIAYPESFLEP